ncbi:TetR/AcrR family transcriptional regulator [Muricauda ruestringensis]|uniref:TetR/AcrR family transcriptional regulator n=1 Tax=Flagellimonas ruestringensis TaxID=111501 RepID=UPI001CD7ECE6|nr:TetR/AcrR family transcriptional regulator [Allomuricauda ruestringensis]MCA0959701.1 TetR/AcrR family transcriptional regulator [Allomuricauda ruestringensis]
MRKIEKIWLETGYKFFAYEGPKGLKVERLSKEVGKNKSSFYHLFADLEVFTERLLEFHLSRAKNISTKESYAKNEEELISIIIEHKIDLLFNRQLRIHRSHPEFKKYLDRIFQFSVQGLLPVWKNIISLSENGALAQMVLHLSLENFYLQITDETLNESWLKAYFADIRQMVFLFKQSK